MSVWVLFYGGGGLAERRRGLGAPRESQYFVCSERPGEAWGRWFLLSGDPDHSFLVFFTLFLLFDWD